MTFQGQSCWLMGVYLKPEVLSHIYMFPLQLGKGVWYQIHSWQKQYDCTLPVSLFSLCLCLYKVSLLSSLSLLSLTFPALPFPSCLSPPTAGSLSLSLSLCMHPTLDLSLYQSNMCRKAPLQGGLTYNVILWQRPQEGHWNETLVNYSGALSWLHALVWNSHYK